MILNPPYNGHAANHRHFDRTHSRFTIDAVEDELGRFFVWDGNKKEVIELCSSWEEACAKAKKTAQTPL